MFGKKEKLKTQPMDLDQDLDFDNFDFGDMSGDFNPEAKAKKRTPVMDIFRGSIGGAKSKLSDRTFLAEVVRDVLPDSYGEVLSTVDTTTGTIGSLYDEAVRELRPQMNRIGSRIDRLVPAERKNLKKVSTKIADILGREYEGSKGPSKEQLAEQSLMTSLAAVFDAQEKSKEASVASDKVEKRLDKSIDAKRFHNEFQVLSNIRDSVSRISNYNEKVNQAYQRKSLELQFRSYFVQTELLQHTKQYNEIFKNQNEGIAKNTALPEYSKIELSERFKDTAKSKVFQQLYAGFFNDGNWIKQTGERFRKRGSEAIKGVKRSLEGGTRSLDDLTEALKQMDESNQMVAEIGGETMSRTELASQIAAGTAIQWLKDKVAPMVKEESEKDTELTEAGYKMLNKIYGSKGWVKDQKKNLDVYAAEQEGFFEGKFAQMFSWALEAANTRGVDTQLETKGLGVSGLEKPSIFDNKTQRAITEVIPGFLAKIYRELQITRTKDESTEETIYDYETGDFMASDKYREQIRTTVEKKLKGSYVAGTATNQLEVLLKGADVAAGMKSKMKKFIVDLSRSDLDIFTPERIREHSLYKSLTDSVREAVDSMLGNLIENSEEPEKGQSLLYRAIRDIRAAHPDYRDTLQSFVSIGHGKQLEKLGYATRSEDKRSYGADLSRMYQELDKSQGLDVEDVYVKSDVNVKEGISRFNPKHALNAIKNTSIFNWRYKKGQGDQEEHTGPMAQDVNANMGEQVAPGGTKIDLTSMNGINMAAIQQLKEDQEAMLKDNKSISILELIHKDTSELVELFKKGGVGLGGGSGRFNGGTAKDLMMNIVSDSFNLAWKTGSGALGIVGSGIGFAKDKIAKPIGNFLSDLFTDKDSKVGKAFEGFLSMSASLALGALKTAQNVLFNKLPAGFGQVLSAGKWMKDRLYEFLDGPCDIFVKGRATAEPIIRANLMKAGHYIDQASGKTIESIKDIKGTVVDISGNVILTTEDVAAGLIDKYGKDLATPFKKIMRAGGQLLALPFKLGLKAVRGAFNLISGIGNPLDGIKGIFSGIGGVFRGFDGKQYDVLVDIREILNKWAPKRAQLKTFRSSDGEGGSKTIDAAKAAGSAAKNKAGEMKEKIVQAKEELVAKLEAENLLEKEGIMAKLRRTKDSLASKFQRPEWTKNLDLPGMPEGVSSKYDKAKSSLLTLMGKGEFSGPRDQSRFQKLRALMTKEHAKEVADKLKDKFAWNDADHNGERDGSWKDRLKSGRAKAEGIKADLTARYKGSNVLDGAFDKIKGFMDFMKTGIGDMFGKVGKIASIGKNVLTSLWGFITSPIKTMSAILKGGKNILSAVGSPVVNTLAKAKNIPGITRVLAMGNTARTAMMAGSLMTGGLGGLVAGVIGVGMSVISTVLASPVLMGAAAIAGLGAAAKWGWNRATRDDLDDYSKIRILQYGLTNQSGDKHHNHEILQLEEYLQEGRIAYRNNEPHLLDKKIDIEDIYNIFSIDKEDHDGVANFLEWFQNRFKPFFLTHIASLVAIDNKKDLSEISDLKEDARLEFLNKVSFESGPYNKPVSPFKDISQLAFNKEAAVDWIKHLIEGLKKSIGDEKKSKDSKALPISTIAKKSQEIAKDVAYEKAMKDAAKRVSDTNKYGYDQKSGGASDRYQQMLKIGAGAEAGADGKPKLYGSASAAGVVGVSSGSVLPSAGGRTSDGSGAEQFIKLGPGDNISNLNPSLLRNFRGMVKEYNEKTGKDVTVTSGFRTNAQQWESFRRDPARAAKPMGYMGSKGSLHEHGLAIDVEPKDLNAMEKLGLMRKYGFTRPVGGEDWHIEAAGMQGQIDSARANHDYASKLIDASLWKGGGGIGTNPSIKAITRDDIYAKSLWGGGQPPTGATGIQDEPVKGTALDNKPVEPTSTYNTFKDNQGVITPGVSASSPKVQEGPFPGYKPWLGGADGEAKPKDVSPGVAGKDTGLGKFSVVTQAVEGLDSMKKIIEENSRKAGIDPNIMQAFAAIESDFNNSARPGTTSAKGLFQFLDGTWANMVRSKGRKYGLDPSSLPTDIAAATLMAAEYAKENIKGYISKIKRDINTTDIYLTHLLGGAGGAKVLKAIKYNPDAPTTSVVGGAVTSANKDLVKAGPTVSKFYNLLSQRLSEKAARYGISIPGGSSPSMEGQTTANQAVATNTPIAGESNKSIPTYKPQQSPLPYSPGVSASTYNTNADIDRSLLPGPDETFDGGPVTPVVFPRPPSYTPTSPSVGESGPGLTSGNTTISLSTVETTLGKSLEVQTQMLDVLKNILGAVSNTGPIPRAQVNPTATGAMNVAAQPSNALMNQQNSFGNTNNISDNGRYTAYPGVALPRTLT